ncbi:uncharacterized protein [Dermacentor andersoni]|uniref:uncharacterized protein isoform X3 n=1 Tax=Dermacentor andersoni TaxID=34620 RepID=UPI003B3B71BA
MAPLNQRYTLVGFSDELDWRPMDFVEPIPAYRICKACGLVPRVTASLPCLHVLCKKCYDRCRHDDGRCCPLDGERVREDDVEWREFPVDNLLKRKGDADWFFRAFSSSDSQEVGLLRRAGMGPRLLHAKALFGKVFRVCKEDLVAYAKTIPSDKLRISYECMLQPVHNESSLYYTRLNLTKEHMYAADKAMACAWKVVGNSTTYIHALDDAAALVRHAALNFGWT